jgi:hypothetical protein
MYSVDITINHEYIMDNFFYFIKKHKPELLRQQRDYILNNQIKDENRKNLILLLPKHNFTFEYDGDIFYYYYDEYKQPTNFQFKEVRFQIITLKNATSVDKINAFINYLSELKIKKKNKRLLTKYTWKEQAGFWDYNKNFKKRKLDTIYLPKKNKDNIIQKIDKFLNNKEMIDLYKKLDITYKKIFLFYGMPGTGKTSFIKSLASNFNYNISVIKNDSQIDDNSLEDMLEILPKKSFLVLEDFDCLFNGRESNSFKTNITFSGVLNILDGINNYDKLIIFITTNYIDKIDDAIKRRVNTFLEFKYIEKDEINQMYNKFFNDKKFETFYKQIQYMKFTPNALEKYFINCIELDLSPLNNTDNLKFYIEISESQPPITNLDTNILYM